MRRLCVDCLTEIQPEVGCFVCECGASFALAITGYATVVGIPWMLVVPQLPEPLA